VAADAAAADEVQHRLLMAQVLEAVRALEEGVLTDIREGDVGAILGWGFAPWSGGPFGWLDMIGAARAVEICDGLTARSFGPRFAAPPADAARHGGHCAVPPDQRQRGHHHAGLAEIFLGQAIAEAPRDIVGAENIGTQQPADRCTWRRGVISA
jgi:hypothetical protein